jgi:CRP/FNR family transcriptional regulator, polysaccharide utilization system transcription regulator
MHHLGKQLEILLGNSDSVFKSLSLKDKEALLAHLTSARIKKGGYIFREHEKFRGIIGLVSGKAKIFRPGIAGREHILKLVRTGDLMGLQVLHSDGVWASSALALEDSVVVIIERQFMTRLLKNNAELAFNAGRLLAADLIHSNNKMVSLTQKHVRGRLAESIIMIAAIYGYLDDGVSLSASLSRNDIAHLSNMTTSNAIRTLSSFANEGIIRIKRRQIAILDLPELTRISEQA